MFPLSRPNVNGVHHCGNGPEIGIDGFEVVKRQTKSRRKMRLDAQGLPCGLRKSAPKRIT